jgi:hypothetical protein
MKKLLIQIHPERAAQNADPLLRHLLEYGSRTGAAVQRGPDSGGYVNIAFRTSAPEKLWTSIRQSMPHDLRASLDESSIVISSGKLGWTDYDLLHHFDPLELPSLHARLLYDRIISTVTQSLAAISDPRFYESERGFQGQLLAELIQRLPSSLIPSQPIVEQEYQKNLQRHGIRIRPDLIIHVPTPQGGDRTRGNYVAIELKLNANSKSVLGAFSNLSLLMERLSYPLGVFINISSTNTHGQAYSGEFPDRMHCFAVQRQANGTLVRHSFFRDGELVTREVRGGPTQRRN